MALWIGNGAPLRTAPVNSNQKNFENKRGKLSQDMPVLPQVVTITKFQSHS